MLTWWADQHVMTLPVPARRCVGGCSRYSAHVKMASWHNCDLCSAVPAHIANSSTVLLVLCMPGWPAGQRRECAADRRVPLVPAGWCRCCGQCPWLLSQSMRSRMPGCWLSAPSAVVPGVRLCAAWMVSLSKQHIQLDLPNLNT